MADLKPMLMLTGRSSWIHGETVEFFGHGELAEAIEQARQFLIGSSFSPRAVVRLEIVQPHAGNLDAMPKCWCARSDGTPDPDCRNCNGQGVPIPF